MGSVISPKKPIKIKENFKKLHDKHKEPRIIKPNINKIIISKKKKDNIHLPKKIFDKKNLLTSKFPEIKAQKNKMKNNIPKKEFKILNPK